MDPRAMDPLGAALRSFQEGKRDAELIIRRDDGVESPIPVSFFFRDPRESSPVDKAGLDLARGRVLDVVRAAGSIASFFKRRGSR